MLIEKSTGTTYTNISEFKQSKPNISFGDLLSKSERELIGLYEVEDVVPSYNVNTQNLINNGIKFDEIKDKFFVEYLIEDKALTQSELDVISQNAQQERWTKIKALRDVKIQNGGFKVGNDWFHSDTFSRTQQIGLIMMQSNIPAGLKWKTMQGTFVDMTPILAQSIFAAAATKDAALFTHAEYLKNNSSVNIYTGWPASYDPMV